MNTPIIQSKTSSSLGIILIILSLVGGLMIYFQVIKPGQILEPILSPQIKEGMSKLKKFKDVKLDFSVFDSSKFKELVTFGEIPVATVSGGKIDLFAP